MDGWEEIKAILRTAMRSPKAFRTGPKSLVLIMLNKLRCLQASTQITKSVFKTCPTKLLTHFKATFTGAIERRSEVVES